MKRISIAIFLAVALALMATAAFAATQNAVVYGTVYDATGNPLPGVSVSLENPSLGFARTTTTGSDGSYNFAEVPPAEGYRLTAARGASKIDIRSGITVNVGDERVILPPLKEQPVVAAGSKPEVKEKKIEGQGVHNETVSTAQSGVITGDQLRTLPLYNRNFLALGLLTPNTHDVEAGSEIAGATFSVNGQRPSSNNFLLDGADNVASSSNQAIPFQVNDSIQEFRVTSSNASAEYGRNGGGTVNVVTRRGGNKFHGSAYGYFGSDALNGDTPLSVYKGTTFDKAAAYAGAPVVDSTQTTAFPLRYNDYVNSAANAGFCTDQIGSATSGACGTGANTLFDPDAILAGHDHHSQPWSSKQFGLNAGGALIQNKLFWFGSYEGTLIDNPNPIFERVPSTFDKTYDPYNTLAFGFANTDPNYTLGQGILNLFPTSNVVAVPGVLEFYQGTAPNYTNVHNGLARFDYTQSDKTSWGLRYALQNLDQLHDDTLPKQATYPGNGVFREALNQSINGSMSHNFTSSLINELRGGFTRFDVQESAQDKRFDARTAGLPYAAMQLTQLTGLDTQYSGSTPTTFGAFQGWGFFGAGSCGGIQCPTLDYLFPMARLGAPLTAPSSRRDTTYYVADNLSWTHGKHAFKFGVEYRNQTNRFSNGAFSRGLLYSSNIGQFTSESESFFTPFNAPSFDFSLKQHLPYLADLSSYQVSFYGQDTWRFHPRWTLTFGLRYEYFSVPEEDHNRLYNFDQAANGLVQEGGGDVVTPYGSPCPTAGTWDSLPGIISVSQTWNCSPSSNGSNQIAKSDKNNIAPRVGIAWDVFGTGNTVIRAATGLYYDQLPTANYAQLMFNRPTPLDPNNPQFILGQSQLFGAGGFGNTSIDPNVIVANGSQAFQSTSQPFAVYAFDTRHTDTPYTWQYSGSIQQAVTHKLAFELGYVGSHGYLLPVINNANYINEFQCCPVNDTDVFSKFPVFKVTNRGESQYDSLLVRMKLADMGGLRLNATYNFAKSTDNASNGVFSTIPFTLMNFSLGPQFISQANPVPNCLLLNSSCGAFPVTFPDLNFTGGAVTTTGASQAITSRYLIPQDPVNFLQNERGPSDFDVHNRFVIDYTWDLPFKSKSMLLSNWTLSGIFSAQTGQPFTVYGGPILGEVNERVNINGPVTLDRHNPNAAILPGSIELASVNCQATTTTNTPLKPTPTTACTGNSGRNAFYGPNFINMNFAVQKGFKIFGEGRMLTLRSEIYNLFNRSNFYNPISQFSTDGFDFNPDFGKIKSAHDPRQVQFAVRFNW